MAVNPEGSKFEVCVSVAEQQLERRGLGMELDFDSIDRLCFALTGDQVVPKQDKKASSTITRKIQIQNCTMPGIDYSKWDNLEVSDDEEEDEQQHDAPFFTGSGGATTTTLNSGMRVTRLEAPSKVTFGGSQQKSDASGNLQQSTNVDGQIYGTKSTIPKLEASNESSATATTPHEDHDNNTTTSVSVPDAWIAKGASCQVKGTPLHWSQDRYSVTLRFGLPLQEGAEKAANPSSKWKCRINGPVLSYADRNTAVSAERSRLQIWNANEPSSSTEYLVDEEISYPIHWEEDSEGEVDWTIERLSHNSKQSFFTISLMKASPMDGLVLWWKKPLASCPEVTVNDPSKASATDFQQAWKEAHEQFRDSVQSKTNNS